MRLTLFAARLAQARPHWLCAVFGVMHCATTTTTTQQLTVVTPGPVLERTARTVEVGPEVALTVEAAEQALRAYGRWEVTSLGRVWFPTLAPQQQFEPYLTDGQWTQSASRQLQWSSTLPWGGITFHYGRWSNVGGRWGWTYGATYAPAWVDWRTADGLIGWAPRSAGPVTAYAYSWVSWELLFDSMLPRRARRGEASAILLGRSRPLPNPEGPAPGLAYIPTSTDREHLSTASFRTVIIRDEQAEHDWQQLMELSVSPVDGSQATPSGPTPAANPSTLAAARTAQASGRQPSFSSSLWSDQDRARAPLVAVGRYTSRYYRSAPAAGAVSTSGVPVATPSSTTAGSQFVIATPSANPNPTSSGTVGVLPSGSSYSPSGASTVGAVRR
jgi:hypothetical protein